MNKPTEILFTDAIPHDVIEKIHLEAKSPMCAWREYLQLTQEDVAERLHIQTGTYAWYESIRHLRKPVRIQIAAALGITAELLDI